MTRAQLKWLSVSAIAFVMGAFVMGVSAATASAQHGSEAPVPSSSPENIRQAQSISRRTMSPFCPGRTLSDCPSPYAAEWRVDIQRMIDEGMSPEEVQKELEKRAGADLSGSPDRSAGYGVPIGLGIAAIALLFGVMRYLRGKRSGEQKQPRSRGKRDERLSEAETQALEARLTEELEFEEEDRL